MKLNVKILEEKKNKIQFEIEGETHTLSAALTKELWTDEHVKAAGYKLEHPLLGKPTFVVETEGEDARKAVSAAVQRLAKQSEKLRDMVEIK